MIIGDRIYGKFEITEPVILELLKCKPMLRLKGISQLGVPDKYHYVRGFSRFEHSVGVMLLLRKLGALIEEQVAGLLHDVSHAAFSHVIDWVLGQGKTENFQDDRHLEFITQSEISDILTRHGYNPAKIADLKSYKLLDTEIPDLCADRIDYSLRQISQSAARKYVKHLSVWDGKIIFNPKEVALSFANDFLDLQINDWAGFEGASRYLIFSRILKRAIDLKIINIDDFLGDEESILKKIEVGRDTQIMAGLGLLRKKSLSSEPRKERIVKKFRHVDPEFLEHGKLHRVSEAYPKFAKRLALAEKSNKKGILGVAGDFTL